MRTELLKFKNLSDLKNFCYITNSLNFIAAKFFVHIFESQLSKKIELTMNLAITITFHIYFLLQSVISSPPQIPAEINKLDFEQNLEIFSQCNVHLVINHVVVKKVKCDVKIN